MATIPSILYRAPNLVVMTFPNKVGISKYRLRAHNTLTGAVTMGATDVMFEVGSGAHFKSESVTRKGRGYPYAPGSTRGHAWVAFDPDDFYDPTTPGVAELPRDSRWAYYTVQEFSIAANAYLTEERRVFIVPSADFYGVKDQGITLTLVVPQTDATEANLTGLPAPLAAVKLHFPGDCNTGNIQNLEAKVLYYSMGAGSPLAKIPASGLASIYSGINNGLVLATTEAAGCEVSISVGLNTTGG